MLAVLSIAAGVFAIGAIFGLVDQLLSTMDKSPSRQPFPHECYLAPTDR